MRVRGLTRGIEAKIYNTQSYLSLHEINETLAAENVALKNRMAKIVQEREFGFFFCQMILYLSNNIMHTSAEVIENSINRQKNFFTINKGDKSGNKS